MHTDTSIETPTEQQVDSKTTSTDNNLGTSQGSLAATAPGHYRVIRRNGKVTGFDREKIAIALTVYFFVGFAMSFIGMILGAFLQAGFLQLSCTMLGMKEVNYEATYRVVAYSQGTIMVWTVVPILGSLFALVVSLIALTTGIAATYNTNHGKAFAAIFLSSLVLPFVIAAIALVLGIILAALGVAAAIAGAAAAG